MEGEGIPVPALSSDAPGQPLPLAQAPGEKKKRHRRTKAELEAEKKRLAGEQEDQGAAKEAEAIKDATAALSVTFQALGGIIGAKRGDYWQLKKEECDALGAAWAVVLAPYLAKFGQSVPVVGALVVTWGVVQPRIQEDQRRKRLRATLDGTPDPDAPALVP